MKKFLLCFLLLGFNIAFSQTVQEVKRPPINNSTEDTSVNPDTPPEYPGGMGGIRSYIGEKFNSSKITGSGIVKSVTKFVIEADGKITSVTTTGNDEGMNNEMSRIIQSMKGKWKPAMLKGKPVRAWVTIPMAFNAESH